MDERNKNSVVEKLYECNVYNKEVMEELIYKMNEAHPFLIQTPLWSAPLVGFSYDNSIPYSQMSNLKNSSSFLAHGDVICGLFDWTTVAEGIFFTDKEIYLNSPKNSEKNFIISYKDITDLVYTNPGGDMPKLRIKVNDNKTHVIDSKMWSKLRIYNFLQFVCGEKEFYGDAKDNIAGIILKRLGHRRLGEAVAGLTYGIVSNASSIYMDDKIVSPRGHGFAAERANHLMDYYKGNSAKIIGDDNEKNGPDRIVNGVNIQSKYCSSGSKCIQSCFENGQFRYFNADGTPMQIEVPSDMYDAAVQAMENRIKTGQVEGVTDPAQASKIVRKGAFTYTQAKNIAKAGTVESIVYDAASGAIIAKNAFGVTAVLTLASSIWNGDDFDIALKKSAVQGLKVGGTTFIAAVFAGQLSKAGLNHLLVGSSDAVISLLGPKASSVLVNAFRSGTNIYGAAALKSASKLLRGNAITGFATIAVLSIGDVGNIFRGRISGGQLFKNLTNTTASVGGGMVGWVAGATAGAAIGSFVPIIGNAVGGLIGGLAGALGGGSIASNASDAILSKFIEDDANEMVDIIQGEFVKLAEDYLINEDEATYIVEDLQQRLTGAKLKDMYASSDREKFARDLLVDFFEETARNRKHIVLPSNEQIQLALRQALEEISDSSVALS